MKDLSVLLTGGAGFLGSHIAEALLLSGARIIVLDNFDDFYDAKVKRAHAAELFLLSAHMGRPMTLIEADLLTAPLSAFRNMRVDALIHLAARPGVQTSFLDPMATAHQNVCGTQAALNLAAALGAQAFLYASSSSVYGDATPPFVEDVLGTPLSPYAACKRAGELLCAAGVSCSGMGVAILRYFTAYGPRQRPDLAFSRFSQAMRLGEPITLFGSDTMRDYTFCTDLAMGTVAALRFALSHRGRCETFNLGSARPVALDDAAQMLAAELKCAPRILRQPRRPGDIDITHADITRARTLLGYSPQVSLEDGIHAYACTLQEHNA